jgi:hypothetical protein
MRIFVATERTQGDRSDDFTFVPEGEPVYIGMRCDREAVNGPCGCARSFTGLQCGVSTTTAVVVEYPAGFLTKYREMVRAALDRATGNRASDAWSAKETMNLLRKARRFESGTVVERRGNRVVARKEAR